MGKYKILCFKGDDVSEKEVSGEPVHFAGYEDFKFFSHTETDSTKWGSFEIFVISEVTSGCKIAHHLSMEGAIAKASALLANDTPEGLQEKISQFLIIKKEYDGN